MKKTLRIVILATLAMVGMQLAQAQNLLTLSPSFESGNGSGPGSTLDGSMWFRTHQGFGSAEVQNLIYRKSENPPPQHMSAYLEAVTPDDPHFNAGWRLQAVNNQNLTNTLENGKKYVLTFFYQNSANHSFSIVIENVNGSGNIATHTISTEATNWTQSQFEFTMNTTEMNNGRLKLNFGANAGTSRIDNLILVEEGAPPPPPQVNLLTLSPSFESGNGSGPGSTLDGSMWFRTHQGFGSGEVQNLIYRKTENPVPQHLSAYLESTTPNDPHFNAGWRLQAINNQNLTNTLENGKNYGVSFYYQNSPDHTFSISIENLDGSGVLANHTIASPASDWTLAEFQFTMDNTQMNNGRLKINLGANAGTTRIDNIVLFDPVLLPVQLQRFTALPHTGGGVRISWQTATEINNSHFVVSRSMDGIQFEELQKVYPKPTGIYEAMDHKVMQGVVYYQLTQFDKDGTPNKLGIRMVNLGRMSHAKAQLYPNPVHSKVVILHTADMAQGNYLLTITDMGGRIMSTQPLYITGGNSQQSIALPSHMPQGFYQILLKGKDVQFTERLLVK